MAKKVKLCIYLSILGMVILSGIYYFVNKYSNLENSSAINMEKTMEHKKLTKDSKISLFSKGKIEKEYSLSQIKEKLNIRNDLNESELVKLLEKEGYVFESTINNDLIFKKKESEIEPNKYYIGEKDGFLAIYKSDANGRLLIENSKDVYKNFKSVSNLGKIDREKIEKFQLMYSSKEEAEENISEFLS